MSLLGRSDETVSRAADAIADLVPRSVATFLTDPDTGLLVEVSDYLRGSTGWVIVLTLIIAIWSGSRGSLTLIAALTRVENETETRPWWRLRLTGMALTGAFALTLLVGSLALVAGARIDDWLGSHISWIGPVSIIAIPGAGAVVLLFLIAFYRWGPPSPLPGATRAATSATVGILAVSLLMRWVLGLLPRPASLAVLGGVAILLLWLNLVAWVMLVAASSAAAMSRGRSDAGRG
jgi:membrane protein